MKIGILGAGTVAQTIAPKLLELKHEVMLSSPDLDKEEGNEAMGKLPSARGWEQQQQEKGFRARSGSFSEAAVFGEGVFNCTPGTISLDVIRQIETESVSGKILIDLGNPLDFSKGLPPTLAFCNTESLGEKLQAALPDTKVVKTLNTVNAQLMVNPSLAGGESSLFIAGNDRDAKDWVKTHLLQPFGWRHIIDLGDITGARAMEMYLPLWLRLWNALENPHFNVKIVK